MANTITGKMSARESGQDTFLPAGPPHTYLGVAKSILPSIILLSENPQACGLGLPMLCAHALECLLKAFLSRAGDDRAVRKSDIRHNLTKLWSKAFDEGLAIPEQPPTWITRLSEVHEPPYFLRYSTKVHGIVTPGREPMVSEIKELCAVVERQLL